MLRKIVEYFAFYHRKSLVPLPSHVLPHLHYIDTPTGKIPHLYYSWTNSQHDNTLIIFSHGNKCQLGTQYKFISSMFYQLNSKHNSDHSSIDILMYEYPGYGYAAHNTNNQHVAPSEQAIQQTILSVYEFALQMGYKPHNIVVMGHSMGTGPTLYLASQRKVGGVILISPYMSIFRVFITDLLAIFRSWRLLQLIGRMSTCFFDIFPNTNYISAPKLNGTPILIAKGQVDRVIHPIHSKLLISQYRATHKNNRLSTWTFYSNKCHHSDILKQQQLLVQILLLIQQVQGNRLCSHTIGFPYFK